MNKRNLIIIEGMDRVGKDYLYNKINIPTLFKYDSKAKNYPSYRTQPNEFKQWVSNYLLQQASELINSDYKNVIMVRFLMSEYVFSTMFKRDTIVQEIHKKIMQYFNIYQIILLFKDYDEYLQRLQQLNERIQYNNEEFNTIKTLYKMYAETLSDSIISVVYETKDFPIQQIISYVQSIIDHA